MHFYTTPSWLLHVQLRELNYHMVLHTDISIHALTKKLHEYILIFASINALTLLAIDGIQIMKSDVIVREQPPMHHQHVLLDHCAKKEQTNS